MKSDSWQRQWWLYECIQQNYLCTSQYFLHFPDNCSLPWKFFPPARRIPVTYAILTLHSFHDSHWLLSMVANSFLLLASMAMTVHIWRLQIFPSHLTFHCVLNKPSGGWGWCCWNQGLRDLVPTGVPHPSHTTIYLYSWNCLLSQTYLW